MIHDYARGFEDALELAIQTLLESRSVEKTEEKLRYYLDLVKEQKFERISSLIRSIP